MKLPWFLSLFRDINFHVQVDDAIIQKAEQIMSALSDQIAAINAKIDAVAIDVTNGFARDKAAIDELTAKVAEIPTPQDMADLAAMPEKLSAISNTANSASPAPVETPPENQPAA